MISMDGVAKHRTERGSAGSNSVCWRVCCVRPGATALGSVLSQHGPYWSSA